MKPKVIAKHIYENGQRRNKPVKEMLQTIHIAIARYHTDGNSEGRQQHGWAPRLSSSHLKTDAAMQQRAIDYTLTSPSPRFH